MDASPGGKNSKETRIGPRAAAVLIGRPRHAAPRRPAPAPRPPACARRRPRWDRAARPPAPPPRPSGGPPQTRQRMLDDALAGALERFVALENPQPSAGRHRRAQPRQQARNRLLAADLMADEHGIERSAGQREIL